MVQPESLSSPETPAKYLQLPTVTGRPAGAGSGQLRVTAEAVTRKRLSSSY